MYRQILKKTSGYSIPAFASRAIGVLLLPIYTRYLTPADYGVMELLDLTADLVGLMLGARLGQALFYFYFAAETPEEKDKAISNVFLGSLLLGMIGTVIALFGCSALSSLVFGSPRFAPYFRLLFLGFASSLPVQVGFCCMRALNHTSKYVWTNLCYMVVSAALNIVLLVWFRMGIAAMLWSALLASIGLSVYMAWYTYSRIRVSFDGRMFWRLLRYSMPLGVSSIAVFFIHYGDRVFLKSTVSLSELGVYSLAYKIGMFVSFLHAPFLAYWLSQVCDVVKKPAGEEVYVRTCTYVTAILAFGAVLLSLFAQPVLSIIASPGFFGAAILVPWLAAAYLIRAVAAHIQSVFTVEGRPGLDARVNVLGSLVCVAGYACLIPFFRVSGAIAATLLGFLVIFGYGLYVAQRLRPFPFEYGRLGGILGAAVVVVGAFYAIHPVTFWHQTGLAFLLSTAYAIVLIAGCLRSGERRAALSAIRSFRRTPAREMAETGA